MRKSDFITRTSHYESFSMGGAGYNVAGKSGKPRAAHEEEGVAVVRGRVLRAPRPSAPGRETEIVQGRPELRGSAQHVD